MIKSLTAVTAEPCPHPYSPDGAVHLSIEPNNKPKQIEIRLPEREPGIRGPPCRPWTQCVENTLINDQVRRPLARCCHKRQMPAIVLPCSVVDQLKAKATETERKCAEREERYRARECQRLASRRRQGEWNFTVEVSMKINNSIGWKIKNFELESFFRVFWNGNIADKEKRRKENWNQRVNCFRKWLRRRRQRLKLRLQERNNSCYIEKVWFGISIRLWPTQRYVEYLLNCSTLSLIELQNRVLHFLSF